MERNNEHCCFMFFFSYFLHIYFFPHGDLFFQASFVTWTMPVSVILAMKMPFVTPTQWMAVPSAPAHQVLLVEPVIKMWMNAPLVRISFFLYGDVQEGMDAWNYASSKQWEGPKFFWDRLTSAGMPLNCFVSSCLYRYNFGPVSQPLSLIILLPAGANPCEHFGKCVNTQGSFQCQCGRGYTGPRCETDINECLSMPCQNDATCLDRIGEFTCICMSGKIPESGSKITEIYT